MVVRSDLTLIVKLKLLIVVNYEQFSGYLLRVTSTTMLLHSKSSASAKIYLTKNNTFRKLESISIRNVQLKMRTSDQCVNYP